MKDSILKGTGNSRFLKSAVPAGTSWADALAMLQAGTFPIDFNGINNAGFQQVGTPLNKANLLKDVTALTLGLTGDAVPNDMFNVLAHAGDLHVWRKTITSGNGTYSLGAVQEGLHYIKWANNSATSDSSGTFEYGSEIAVNKDGTITGIKNPSTITIKPWNDDASKANVFKGKFIKMISQVETGMSHFKIGEIWWIPADAAMTKGLLNGESGRWYIAASKRQQVIGVPAGTTVTYPVSTNRNAYQEGNDAKPAGYTLGEVVTGSFSLGTTDGTQTYTYESATSLDVGDDGTVSLQNPSSGSFGTMGGLSPGDNLSIIQTFILGKFVRCTGINTSYVSGAPDTKYPFNVVPSDIVYIPSNANVTKTSNVIYIDRYQPVTGYAAIPANTTIEYLGCLGDKARVQVVSYVGTGTYGSSNPNSLTFDFPPKVVRLLGAISSGGNFTVCSIYPMNANYGVNSAILFTKVLTTTYKARLGFSANNYTTSYCKISQDGKTVTWYNTDNDQINTVGYTYYFLALS